MKRATLPFEAKQLEKMYQNGTLIFDYPIQRQGGQWSEYNKSLLISSICGNFIVPAVYMLKEQTDRFDNKKRRINNYYVIDGKQRLETVFTYLDNGFKISEDIPDVDIDDETYRIAGKFFSELDEEVQQEIRHFRFSLVTLEECTDEEIEETFFRLNNGVALTKSQKAAAKIGTEMAKKIKELVNGKFFSEICHFTKTQMRAAQDECTIIQSMMILDDHYELSSISESEVLKYAGAYNDQAFKRVKIGIEFLEETFSEKEKFLKKINIPMIIYMGYKATEEGINPDVFHAWFKDFEKSYNPECAYAQMCGSGSVKKNKVLGRIQVLEKSFNSFNKHQ